MLARLRDYLHERRIAAEKVALLAATTFEARRIHAARMRDLINQRSPDSVARMERDRGLT
ncbi:hypothetical protein GPA27_13535 [Aromatoleum toluolicum]|uniref:Uncharacterized protein n=1 Tax=Aromatoleum toluolicum TaxID=90060 RepID=A0ABX1NGW1_9RHOO|nr:hypothetical protein [Aromatoleum toluolicum]NMF98408.1 hypothetical protein [Aromatoleum toluolicum]